MSPLLLKILYSVLIIVFLILSFLTGRLSVKIEGEGDKPINVIEDYSEPEAIDKLAELIKEDHSCQPIEEKVCPPCTNENSSPQISTATPVSTDAKYVASKKSSGKVFHPIDSSVAQRIKVENRLYFATQEEAMTAGYQPSKYVK